MYKLAPIFLFVFGFAKTVEVYYQTDTPIAGFQFHVLGMDVTDAGDGVSEAAGFMTFDNETTVIGFSLTGGIIPSGNYTIMYVDFIGDISTICFSYLIVSDPDGNAIDYEIGECWVP